MCKIIKSDEIIDRNYNTYYTFLMNNISITSRLDKTLQETGFSDGAARIYIAVMSLGMAHISAIAREAGMKRTTIYEYIEDLLKQTEKNLNKCFK